MLYVCTGLTSWVYNPGYVNLALGVFYIPNYQVNNTVTVNVYMFTSSSTLT